MSNPVAQRITSTLWCVPDASMNPVELILEMSSVKTVTFGSMSASRYPGAGVGRRQPGLKSFGIIVSQRRSSWFNLLRICSIEKSRAALASAEPRIMKRKR